MAPSRYMHSAKNSAVWRPASMEGASREPRTDTACVATMPRSHAPLMPTSSNGFVSRTIMAVKNA